MLNQINIAMILRFSLIALTFLVLFGCNKPVKKVSQYEKFEPADGQCILFIGQDLEAIGGLDVYNDGYLDHFKIPGGFTMYTNFRPGDSSYGYTYKGLDGVKSTADWGSGESNMQMQLDDSKFKNMALAIGLELVNHDSLTAIGANDNLITELGHWIAGLGNRPVFLRIGYEFDAPDWNHYRKDHYIASFQRIRHTYDSMGINNVAYVWQSKGWGSDTTELASWYPGDEYVDWCGYTHFIWGVEGGKPMIDFARKHDKPVFIAEVTPMIFQGDTLPQDCFLDNKEQADYVWDNWFIPFFDVIHGNQDVVKAISYINVDWPSQKMWENNVPFKHVDSRLQINPEVKKKWEAEVSKPTYLHASENLFNDLWNNN